MSQTSILERITGTDQPGRYLAVFVVAPIIAYKSYIYRDSFLLIFSMLLMSWDMYWLLSHAPKNVK